MKKEKKKDKDETPPTALYPTVSQKTKKGGKKKKKKSSGENIENIYRMKDAISEFCSYVTDSSLSEEGKNCVFF